MRRDELIREIREELDGKRDAVRLKATLTDLSEKGTATGPQASFLIENSDDPAWSARRTAQGKIGPHHRLPIKGYEFSVRDVWTYLKHDWYMDWPEHLRKPVNLGFAPPSQVPNVKGALSEDDVLTGFALTQDRFDRWKAKGLRKYTNGYAFDEVVKMVYEETGGEVVIQEEGEGFEFGPLSLPTYLSRRRVTTRGSWKATYR